MIFVNKIFLVILIIFHFEIFSQTSLENQFEKAKVLFNQEKYFDAITEFKRLLFFDKQNSFGFDANYYIGLSYKFGGKYDEALRYFTLAEIKSADDSEYFSVKIHQVRINILRRTLVQANRILDELENDKKFFNKKNEIKYWRGWSYIFASEWKKASDIFGEDNLDSSLSVLCKNTDEQMYSVGFAKYSSYLIPGFGQFYTGEYISGVISLGWNLLFGYLTVNSFTDERVFDGIMVGNFLWLRFYSGNIQNAEKYAVQKNLIIENNALNYLQKDFAGIKP